MQIYVVQSGDTLWNIAKTYSTTAADIAEANEIPEPDRLVVGQALVIPIQGMYYFIQPGDTLWQIGRRYGMDYRELARINNINPYAVIYPGQRIYIPQRIRTAAVANAYFEPIGVRPGQMLLNDARNAAPYLSYFAPFSYEAQPDGTLDPPPTADIASIASSYGNSLMMVVTNLSEGQFSGELARTISESAQIQDNLIRNILSTADEAGIYTDIHFDFEYIPVDLRDRYTAFIRKAAEAARAAGYQISVALAPKTNADQKGQWYAGHDYGALGSIVDFVVIMTYEWGYSGGPPMAVSPIVPVERVLQYALTEMPANKILMGQNLYGYDWTLPYVAGERFARALSPQSAINVARDNFASISYDERAQAPFFFYRDAEGRSHEVWFEDARSIQAKFDLIKRLKLKGISYWKIGFQFPQNWLLLGDNFNITRYQNGLRDIGNSQPPAL